MKYLTFYLALLPLLLVSCQKPIENDAVRNANMTFKADGTPVTNAKAIPLAIYYKSDTDPSIVINGSFNSSESILLRIISPKTGSFILAQNGTMAGYATDPNHYYLAQTGVVTFTTFTDTRIAGTFQFIGEDSNNQDKTITGGTFDLPLKVMK